MLDLRAYLAEGAKAVEAVLDAVLPPADREPRPLHQAMRYSVFGGGKRLRPTLCLAACELVGGERDSVLPVAAALEMVHTYSLIHDDLPCMDDDALRRGRPTCHVAFGEATAMLAGDALLTQAFVALGDWAAQGDWSAAVAVRVIGEIARGAGSFGMVGGQALDLAAEGQERSLAELEAIHRLKTGALFGAALRAGAIAGGAGEGELAAIDRYAAEFGLAFQIRDDILDVVGDAARLGKPVRSDLKKHKATYPAVVGLERAQILAGEAADRAAAALDGFSPGRAEPLRALVRLAVSREN